MIRLQRDRTAIPAKYRGAGLVKMLTRLLASYYDSDGRVPFNKNKSLQVWKDAKAALDVEAAGKCAYCEWPSDVNQYCDVEHFRPKDLYWWLAFSYDNYTFSCQLCNQKYKVAEFPVTGRRVRQPVALPKKRPNDHRIATLAASLCPDPAANNTAKLVAYFKSEKAHLPHPYLVDPEKLFAWQVDDVNREVRLVPRTKGVAARRAVTAAADHLGLNREPLMRWRYAIYEVIRVDCLVLQGTDQQSVRDLVMPKLRRAAASSSPFAGMVRHFLREWNVLE